MKRLLWYPCRMWWLMFQVPNTHCLRTGTGCMDTNGCTFCLYGCPFPWAFAIFLFPFFLAWHLVKIPYQYGAEPLPLPKPKAVGNGALTLQDKGGEVTVILTHDRNGEMQ